jgi:hypothetical protein
MKNLIKMTSAAVGWEIMNHVPYSTDLAFNDHVSGPMKVHLQGQNLQTEAELKYGNMNWLHSWNNTFHAAGFSNLPGRWEKCLSVLKRCRCLAILACIFFL